MNDYSSIAPGKKNRKKSKLSTQTHLKIGEIKENTLVLKNGGLRGILKCTSINFNLKSEDEQNAITASYQGFLNALEFPIQIIIRSKKLDIDDYIEEVKKIGDEQENSLLKEQTYEYAQYIKKLIEYANIMEKQFYVIVPYNPGRVRNLNFFQKIMKSFSPQDSYGEIKQRHKEFNNAKKKLQQRLNIIETGLENCGIKTEEIKTEEIIELFYSTYNPSTSRTAKIKDIESTDLKPNLNQI